MECPQLPDWETEAGTVQRQSTGLDSSDLGLVKLGLFPFPPPKPLGDGAASPTEAGDMQWVQLPGALETILCPLET